jgi:hypothetical protein
MGELCLRSEGAVLACFVKSQGSALPGSTLLAGGREHSQSILCAHKELQRSALFCATNSSVATSVFGVELLARAKLLFVTFEKYLWLPFGDHEVVQVLRCPG